MHNPTGITEPHPKHTDNTPRIYHRLITGTRQTICGKVLRSPKRLPFAEVKRIPHAEMCPRCRAMLKMDEELTAHLEENAKLPLTAFRLIARLDDGDMN